MPNITVKIVGGKEKENLTALTVDGMRWGVNGAAWGTAQNVPVGNAAISAYYAGKESAAGTASVEESDSTLAVTADGPGSTTCELS